MTDLARKWKVDVDCGYPGAASWQPLYGITSFNPTPAEPVLQDNTDYDVVNGWTTQEKTGQAWSAECTYLRKKVAGVYPVAQEKLRTLHTLIGSDNVARIRYYDRNGEAEAYQVDVNVALTQANAGVTDLFAVTANFTAYSGLTAIANPLA